MSSPPPSTAGAFDAEVAGLRAGERRRRFPLGVHVGHPVGPRRGLEVAWPVPCEYDAGLRFDVADRLVLALMEEWSDPPAIWGWVTRPGVPELHDCDLEWFAGVSRAVGAHDVVLAGFRAVTRTGWHDVVSGESFIWRRPRP